MTPNDTGNECQTIVKLIDSYLDGCLDEERAARVKKHLARCPSCQQEVREIADFEAAVAKIEKAAPSPGFTGKVMQAIREEQESVTTVRPAERAGWKNWWENLWMSPSRLALAGALLVMVLLIFVIPLYNDKPETQPVFIADLQLKRGNFSIQNNDGCSYDSSHQIAEPVSLTGININSGDRVVVQEDSVLAMMVPGKMEIRLYANSVAEFSRNNAFIPRGKVCMKFSPSAIRYRVKSPHIVTEIVGTELEFLVGPDGTEVRLLSGKISVSTGSEPARLAEAPVRITAGKDGQLEIQPLLPIDGSTTPRELSGAEAESSAGRQMTDEIFPGLPDVQTVESDKAKTGTEDTGEAATEEATLEEIEEPTAGPAGEEAPGKTGDEGTSEEIESPRDILGH